MSSFQSQSKSQSDAMEFQNLSLSSSVHVNHHCELLISCSDKTVQLEFKNNIHTAHWFVHVPLFL